MTIFTRITTGQSIAAATFNDPMVELESAISAGWSLIADYTAVATVSTITLSSIPSTYTDLYMSLSLASASSQTARLVFNGDTNAANYETVIFTLSYAGGLLTQQQTGLDRIHMTRFVPSGQTAGATAQYSAGNINIPKYTGTHPKTIYAQSAFNESTDYFVTNVIGRYLGTAAISSILVQGQSGDLIAGSHVALYGRGS